MTELWTWVAETFNNREIAGVFWLTGALLLSCKSKDIRSSLAQFIALAFHRTLLTLFVLFAANVAAICFFASKMYLWDTKLVVPTIVWFFLGGLILLGRSFQAKEDSNHFRGYAVAAIGGVALFEFIYLARTFSLGAELVLVPVVTVVGLFAVFSERDPEHASVKKLMTWFQIIIVVAIFWNSISQIWAVPVDFFNSDTFKSFVLPIYLTICSIPFFRLLVLLFYD